MLKMPPVVKKRKADAGDASNAPAFDAPDASRSSCVLTRSVSLSFQTPHI